MQMVKPQKPYQLILHFIIEVIKLKIEIETKELTALLDYIKGQREPIGNTQVLVDEVVKGLPQKITSQLNLRT